MSNLMSHELSNVSEHIREQFVAKNSARDTAISASRELIRQLLRSDPGGASP